MKKLLIIALFLTGTYLAPAQELLCTVTVNSQQIGGSDRSVFDDLQKAVMEFMNNRKWTNYSYKQEEKIECNIFINITERASDVDFSGTIQVQSRRPVFNTSYNSTMLNILDKDFQFKYVQKQALEYDDNNLYSNLTAVLAYYAYIIIGLDFDSYTPRGGTPYYLKAQNLSTLAQNSAEKGWKSFESKKNRFWLVENLLNDSYGGIRDCIYLYHLKGMDVMKENMANARTQITEGMKKVQQVNINTPGLYLVSAFMDTKREELINIYSQADPSDKAVIVNILKSIDPAHSNDYNTRILNAK